jgi:hypothetical protein
MQAEQVLQLRYTALDRDGSGGCSPVLSTIHRRGQGPKAMRLDANIAASFAVK